METTCELFVCPIEELADRLEPASVDWIITDPPYPERYLETFSSLSQLGSRVLKPSGGMLVMSGQHFLPEVMSRLDEHMQYHWCCCYLTPGGQAAYNFPRKVNPFWKPVLIYKRRDSDNWERSFGDVIKDLDVVTTSANNNDKKFHHWGQNVQGFHDLVRRFTKQDDLVIDPFVGGGTTAIAALQQNRRFKGSDSDAACIEKSQARVAAYLKSIRSSSIQWKT